jgi:transcriptional regulator
MTFHYKQYRSEDTKIIKSFIQRFPLALITSFINGKWQSSHIPLFWSNDAHDELFGHVDASNEQFSDIQELAALVVFSGPNAYIPPEAYVTKQLPTWNYLCVHVTGTFSVDEDPDRNIEILRETAYRLQDTPSQFSVLDSDQRIRKWIGSVRGIRLKIDEIEGRFKLSQDKTAEDVLAAANYFSDVIGSQISPDLLLSFSGLKAHTNKDIQL